MDSPDGAGLAPLPASALVTRRRRAVVLTLPCNVRASLMLWLTRRTLPTCAARLGRKLELLQICDARHCARENVCVFILTKQKDCPQYSTSLKQRSQCYSAIVRLRFLYSMAVIIVVSFSCFLFLYPEPAATDVIYTSLWESHYKGVQLVLSLCNLVENQHL